MQTMSIILVEGEKGIEAPFHFKTLKHVPDDVRAVLTHRLIKQRAIQKLAGEGHLFNIDEVRFKPGSYQYDLEVDDRLRYVYPEVAQMEGEVSGRVSNGGVILIPTVILRFLHNTFEYVKGYREFLAENEGYIEIP